MNLWKRKTPEKQTERRRKALAVLGLYLDDLLLVSGGVCLVAAALRWGAAAGLATAGGFLLLFSVLAARAGRR